jgi:sensor histidine kinase YesM
LYSLSLSESAKTTEGIAQMASLLQAVLYECNESEIPVEKEVKLIENYVELERLRYGSDLNLNFKISGPVEKWQIAPMLLFTFVENCFKHGGKRKNGKIDIEIKLVVTEEKLLFQTENSLPAKTKVSEKKSSGVGVRNAKKRLEILYENRYRLSIKKNVQTWKVVLELEA